MFGESTRLRRNSPSDAELHRDAAALEGKFAQRGYGRKEVSRWTGAVLHRDRESVLRGTPNESDKIPNFITQNTGTETPSLREIVTRHWNIVGEDSEAGRAFPRQPRITYRRCGNIKDMLVRAKL